MGKRHKWADVIVAWSEGAEIEARNRERYHDPNAEFAHWWTIKDPHWETHDDIEYRIKPPKVDEKLLEKVMKGIDEILARNQPSKEPQYLYVYELGGEYRLNEYKADFMTFVFGEKMRNMAYIGRKIKLEQDDA